MLVPRRELITTIEIKAPIERVWNVLTDFPTYPQWNPMIRQVTGELRTGGRLSVHFQPAGRKPRRFKPKLILVAPNRELRWLGWPRFPTLFDSEHYWRLQTVSDGSTHLEHGMVMYGLLAPVAAILMEDASRAPFEAMNRAHKARAEARP